MVIIRSVKDADANALSALFSQLDSETPFMAMGEQNSATELSEHLALFINSATQVLYVIEQDQYKLLGFAIGITGYISGNSHTAALVIGIQQASIGRGFGLQLLAHVEMWALRSKLTQLELTVMADNKNAIVFYNNHGFKPMAATSLGIVEHELYMLKVLRHD